MEVMSEEERMGGGNGGDEMGYEFCTVLVTELKGSFEFLSEFGYLLCHHRLVLLLLLLPSSLSAGGSH